MDEHQAPDQPHTPDPRTRAGQASTLSDAVEQVDLAIQEARAAAKRAGFDLDDVEDDSAYHQRLARSMGRALTSFAFRLDRLESAVQATKLEQELNALSGVEAHVIYSTNTAWISAEDHISPDTIMVVLRSFGLDGYLTDSSLRRRSSRLETSHIRRRMRRHADAHRRSREAAEQRTRAGTPMAQLKSRITFESTEGLYTARELITRGRLILAFLLGLPVIAMQIVPSWQFDYWQWISLALATPVVTWCAWPFHRATLGGLRRGMSALDGASSLAILIAYGYSLSMLLLTDAGDIGWLSPQVWLARSWDNPAVEGTMFLDVACGVTMLLLFGRLLSRRTHLRSKSMLAALSVPTVDNLTVVRKSRAGKQVKKKISTAEIRVGDDIIIPGGTIIPSDAEVISGKSLIDVGPVGGLHSTAEVSVGDRVYAGGRNLGAALKIRVHSTGSKTRLAAMHRWVLDTARDENRFAQLANRSASLLVPWAVVIATANFLIWLWTSGSIDAAMATSLSVLACVGPVALALSAPLALRLGLWRAATMGTLLRDTGTIHTLSEMDAIVFNRVGTLTHGPMRVMSITAAPGESSDLVLRVAGALSLESDHAVSQAIVRADREARDVNSGDTAIPHWIETGEVSISKDGVFSAMVDLPVDGGTRHVTARLWRPRDLGQIREPHLAAAAVSGGSPVVVSWKGKDRGVITLTDQFKDDAADAIDRLEEMDIETFMLSRDTYPVARRIADTLGISTVFAGIAPNRKEAVVRELHAQGRRVTMVGDNDTLLALRAADAGILMGAADRINASVAGAADVVMLRDDVQAIPDTINMVRHVRNTVDWNIWISWTYNVIAIVCAVVGIMNPLIATVTMLLSSELIERRSARILNHNFSSDSLRHVHTWDAWTNRLRAARERRKRGEHRARVLEHAREAYLEERR